MGEVFWERDEKLNREVAIKVLPADMSYDEEHLMQFKGERQILASLNHPNIPAIYGVKDSDQVVALLMELVHTEAINEGRKAHLRELLSRMALPQKSLLSDRNGDVP